MARTNTCPSLQLFYIIYTSEEFARGYSSSAITLVYFVIRTKE